MKRALSIIVVTLFFAGIFIAPTSVTTPSARLQDNTIPTTETLNDQLEPAELPNDRTFRVAFYNETNPLAPAYATPSMNNNYSMIHDVLFASDYDVTLVTVSEISNYELTTANYDVVILADNCPRENITDHVKDFWLAGGGVLALDSAAGYLGYAGMLPRENESVDDGFAKWWQYENTNVSKIVEKTPISQSYDNGSKIVHKYADWAVYNWTRLMQTTIASYLTKIAVLNGTNDQVTALSADAQDRGGRVAWFGIPVKDFPTDWESMLLDAIGWLAPRPKAKIAYDFSHQPRLSVDEWDEFSTVWSPLNSYADLRDSLVTRHYTFDKFFPSESGNFTASRLAEYDIIMIVWPDLNFTEAERTAFMDWVNNGGGALVLGDGHLLPGGGPGNEHINFLIDSLDMALDDDDLSSPSTMPVAIPSHPTTEDCTTFDIGYRNSINITGGAAIPVWEDADNITVAAQDYGAGRVMMFTDMNSIDNSYLDDYDNEQFAINTMNWLSAADAKVLLYTGDPYGGNYYRTMVADALNQLEIPFYLTFTETGINATLNGTWYGDDWDLVIIDNCNWQRQDSYPHILDYLKTGKQMILTSWTLPYENDDPLWSFIGVNWTESMTSNNPSYIWDSSHPIFDGLVNYTAPTLNVSNTFFAIDGFKLQVFDNATALTGATPTEEDGNASIVLTNTRQVLFNGFFLNSLRGDADDSAYMDGFELYMNEISFMMSLPEIDHPADIKYEAGTTGHSIMWDPNDSSPDSYEIYIDGVLEDSGSWDGSNITADVDGLYYGNHTVECRVVGDSGYPRGDIVVVNVVDTLAPLLNSPSDITMVVETTGNTLEWVASDPTPSHYVILLNSSEYESGVWDGSSVELDLDDLDVGVYFFTLRVNDTLGHVSEDTVLVTVTEPGGIGLPEWLDTQTLLLIVIGVLVLVVIAIACRRRK